MAAKKGFTIEVSSRFEGFWRYNVAMTCGCFDADGRRTDFVAASSHVAEVGSDLPAPPDRVKAGRKTVLETPPCDHLLCYLYIVPHTLPKENAVDSAKPFEIELKICCAGRKLRTEKRLVNQWSGASIEFGIAAETTS